MVSVYMQFPLHDDPTTRNLKCYKTVECDDVNVVVVLRGTMGLEISTSSPRSDDLWSSFLFLFMHHEANENSSVFDHTQVLVMTAENQSGHPEQRLPLLPLHGRFCTPSREREYLLPVQS